MNKKLGPILIVLICISSILVGQQMKPLAPGVYNYKKVSYDDPKFKLVASEDIKIKRSSEDEIEIEFPVYNVGSWSYRGESFFHLKDNIYARRDYSGNGTFADDESSVLVLREGNAIEVYRLNRSVRSPQFRGGIVIAADGADFKSLKSALKANMASFDLKALVADITAINEKIVTEGKAKKEAEMKAQAEAIAQARSGADLCTPLKRFIPLASGNFQTMKGERDAEESELEGEEIHRTNEDLPLFAKGFVFPTYVDDKMRLSFRTNAYRKKEDAAAELAFIKGKLDPCFSNTGGFKASTDSGIHFYKSSSVTIAIGTKKDWDDDGNDISWVWLTLQQK